MDIKGIFSKIGNALIVAKIGRVVPVSWIKAGDGWLSGEFTQGVSLQKKAFFEDEIESLADNAARLGEMPLWKGFERIANYPFPVKNSTRNANQVRVGRQTGRFFYHLVLKKQPDVIVEIGTAFGVSGMYWMAGLRQNDRGFLFAFEPNEQWAKVADQNMSKIGKNYMLSVSTFEENHENCLQNRRIDIAFIDAIHTEESVAAQYAIVRKYSKRGTLVIFDDIKFSKEMDSCWRKIASSTEVQSSFSILNRIGVVELS